jgi:hypothetical protein
MKAIVQTYGSHGVLELREIDKPAAGEATTLAEIAETAGIATRTIFASFPGKEDTLFRDFQEMPSSRLSPSGCGSSSRDRSRRSAAPAGLPVVICTSFQCAHRCRRATVQVIVSWHRRKVMGRA